MVDGTEVLRAEAGEIVDDADRLEVLFEDALARGLEAWSSSASIRRTRPARATSIGSSSRSTRAGRSRTPSTASCWATSWAAANGPVWRRRAAGRGLRPGCRRVRDRQQARHGLSDEQWREVRQRADPLRTDERPARVRSTIEPSAWVEPETGHRGPGRRDHAARRTTAPASRLRFPRVIRFREGDKRPEDATSLKELLGLYQAQPGHV